MPRRSANLEFIPAGEQKLHDKSRRPPIVAQQTGSGSASSPHAGAGAGIATTGESPSASASARDPKWLSMSGTGRAVSASVVRSSSGGGKRSFADAELSFARDEGDFDEEGDDDDEEEEDEDEDAAPKKKNSKKRNKTSTGRRKIDIEYIGDKSKRHVSFTKRKSGLMKKGFELSTLTGTQCLILVVSETGLVYTYATDDLKPIVEREEGRSLVGKCLRGEFNPGGGGGGGSGGGGGGGGAMGKKGAKGKGVIGGPATNGRGDAGRDLNGAGMEVDARMNELEAMDMAMDLSNVDPALRYDYNSIFPNSSTSAITSHHPTLQRSQSGEQYPSQSLIGSILPPIPQNPSHNIASSSSGPHINLPLRFPVPDPTLPPIPPPLSYQAAYPPELLPNAETPLQRAEKEHIKAFQDYQSRHQLQFPGQQQAAPSLQYPPSTVAPGPSTGLSSLGGGALLAPVNPAHAENRQIEGGVHIPAPKSYWTTPEDVSAAAESNAGASGSRWGPPGGRRSKLGASDFGEAARRWRVAPQEGDGVGGNGGFLSPTGGAAGAETNFEGSGAREKERVARERLMGEASEPGLRIEDAATPLERQMEWKRRLDWKLLECREKPLYTTYIEAYTLYLRSIAPNPPAIGSSVLGEEARVKRILMEAFGGDETLTAEERAEQQREEEAISAFESIVGATTEEMVKTHFTNFSLFLHSHKLVSDAGLKKLSEARPWDQDGEGQRAVRVRMMLKHLGAGGSHHPGDGKIMLSGVFEVYRVRSGFILLKEKEVAGDATYIAGLSPFKVYLPVELSSDLRLDDEITLSLVQNGRSWSVFEATDFRLTTEPNGEESDLEGTVERYRTEIDGLNRAGTCGDNAELTLNKTVLEQLERARELLEEE